MTSEGDGPGRAHRLFVAVWPPEHVLDLVERLGRPPVKGLRWTTRDQWHVTLRFLGEVADVEPVSAALAGVAAAIGPATATLGVAGPTTQNDQPVGTVFMAVAVGGEVESRESHLPATASTSVCSRPSRYSTCCAGGCWHAEEAGRGRIMHWRDNSEATRNPPVPPGSTSGSLAE